MLKLDKNSEYFKDVLRAFLTSLENHTHIENILLETNTTLLMTKYYLLSIKERGIILNAVYSHPNGVPLVHFLLKELEKRPKELLALFSLEENKNLYDAFLLMQLKEEMIQKNLA